MVIEGTENLGEILNVLGAMAETKSGFFESLDELNAELSD